MSEYINPIEFENFLNQQTGERSLSDFFKDHPQTLYWTFCRGAGHCRFVFREFPIGSRYFSDFVILNSYSGVWEVMFIELEPIDDTVFTKSSKPTKRLANALKQVDDWAEYYDDNKQQIRSDLGKWAKEKDILGYNDGNNPSNMSGDYLADPNTFLKDSYHIIIGRRHAATKENNKRKATYGTRHRIEIMSYDRILDLAKVRYANPETWE